MAEGARTSNHLGIFHNSSYTLAAEGHSILKCSLPVATATLTMEFIGDYSFNSVFLFTCSKRERKKQKNPACLLLPFINSLIYHKENGWRKEGEYIKAGY
jgi:hypothetical protein